MSLSTSDGKNYNRTKNVLRDVLWEVREWYRMKTLEWLMGTAHLLIAKLGIQPFTDLCLGSHHRFLPTGFYEDCRQEQVTVR